MKITATENGITIDFEDGTPLRAFRMRNPRDAPVLSWSVAEPVWGAPLNNVWQPKRNTLSLTADVGEIRVVDA